MFGFYSSYFLFFGLRITYYGLIIACAIGLGVFLACNNAKARKIKSDNILVAACYIVPIAIICAHFYYILFDGEPQSVAEVFKIWDGISIMGAVLGGALGLGLYCLIHKKNFLEFADIIVPSVILGQAVGRFGCYFAGCCRGIVVTDPALTWFPLSVFEGGVWRLSTFFYESIWNFLTFIILIILLRHRKLKNMQKGYVAASYLLIYGVGRAWIELLRGDSLMIGSAKVSVIVSLLMAAAGIAIFVYFAVRNRKHKTVNGEPASEVAVESFPSNGEVVVELPPQDETFEKPTQKPETKPKQNQKSKIDDNKKAEE